MARQASRGRSVVPLSGVSTDERGRVEALLSRAEALTQGHAYKDAIAVYEEARQAVAATNSVELDVRARAGESWARMQEGDVRTAIELLNGARGLTEGSVFSDVDRADIDFRLGVCRYKLSSIGTAVALFNEALKLAESSELPCDTLRSDIFHWRSRCHRRQRDFEAAREDVERALELAQGLGDRAMMANAYFQASLVAERTGHWLLSRNYAEQAKKLFQELEDERNVGRLLINLGGLNLLLGKPQEAIQHLKASFAVAVEVDSQGDAAQAMGGLATVHLHLGGWDEADEHARHALGSSTAAKISSTRSASHSSCSGGRCSSADGSTRPRTASGRRTPPSSSSPRSAIAPARGSPWAISPRAGARMPRPRASSEMPPKLCRTSGSKKLP